MQELTILLVVAFFGIGMAAVMIGTSTYRKPTYRTPTNTIESCPRSLVVDTMKHQLTQPSCQHGDLWTLTNDRAVLEDLFEDRPGRCDGSSDSKQKMRRYVVTEEEETGLNNRREDLNLRLLGPEPENRISWAR